MTGNYSAILSSLDRRFEALEISRGFAIFHLMTIMDENHHSLIHMEHAPLIYKDAQEMAEYVLQALRDTAREAAVLLYAPGADPNSEDLVKSAGRVFYFNE